MSQMCLHPLPTNRIYRGMDDPARQVVKAIIRPAHMEHNFLYPIVRKAAED